MRVTAQRARSSRFWAEPRTTRCQRLPPAREGNRRGRCRSRRYTGRFPRWSSKGWCSGMPSECDCPLRDGGCAHHRYPDRYRNGCGDRVSLRQDRTVGGGDRPTSATTGAPPAGALLPEAQGLSGITLPTAAILGRVGMVMAATPGDAEPRPGHAGGRSVSPEKYHSDRNAIGTRT